MAALYLSHAMSDAPLAGRLRDALSLRGVLCAADDARMGDRATLPPAVETALAEASGLVVLATPAGCASAQVHAEVAHVIEAGSSDAIAVVTADLTAGELAERCPALAALGSHALPADPTDADIDRAAYLALAATRIGDPLPNELVVDFDAFEVVDGRVRARVWVGARSGTFDAPLGVSEAEERRWYLESYHRWPAEAFEVRAGHIEAKLPGWGEALWRALAEATGPALYRWLRERDHPHRVLTLRMASPRPVPLDAEGEVALTAGMAEGTRQLVLAEVAATRATAPDDRPVDVIAAHRRENVAQARVLALPWEALRTGGQYLFGQQPPVAVRRVLVPRVPLPPLRPRAGQVRVLVIVARPDRAGLIDPGASADDLIDAVAPLGDAVRLDFLRPPTLDALSRALCGGPYDVVHFDGHGVYDPRSGLGYLCFEHRDPVKRAAGEPELVDGAAIRHALGDHRLPLAFLEACQTAASGETADAAVASALLAAGAESVVAMSHSVLVTTATRFTAAFYAALVEGRAVSAAMVAGRRALAADPARGSGEDPRRFELHDWHVPLLYQRGGDPVLVPGGVARYGGVGAAERAARYATLPTLHRHPFVGRLRERLALERALEDRRVALILGVGGQGKTTLAAELGRWLVRCERFRAAAFVSVEQSPPVEAVLNDIGRALMGDGYVIGGVGEGATQDAIDAIGRWLESHRGLIIADNIETLLPPPADAPAAEQMTHQPELLAGVLDALWALARRGESRVVITSREEIDDARFRHGRTTHVQRLGGLAVRDAIALVGEVCRNEGVAVEPGDDGALEEMVRAVGCHPRCLVVLPAELRTRGVGAVTEDLHGLMVALEAKYPGERARSLIASVKLSLDRLPRKWREVLPPLGLLRGGVSAPVLGLLLGWDGAQVCALVAALAERGVVERELAGDYLRFHPALGAVLEVEARAGAPEVTRGDGWPRVVDAYRAWVVTLYRAWNGPRHAYVIAMAQRELPNLLRVLDHLVGDASDEGRRADAIDYATSLESLLQNSSHRRALNGIAERRATLAEGGLDGQWSHARHVAEASAIDRLVDAERPDEALARALTAEARARSAVEAQGWDEAPFDHAQALFRLGRVLETACLPVEALSALDEAQAAFEGLPDPTAQRMASACLTARSHCLTALGRYTEAEACCSEAIRRDRARGDIRDVGVGVAQRATARMLRDDLEGALGDLREARRLFEALDEPLGVARVLHQLGMTLRSAMRLAEAEDAYKGSLALRLRHGARVEAGTVMHELVGVALFAGRVEEAVAWAERAVDLFSAEGHRGYEAMARHHLALARFRLGRLDEAEADARAAAMVCAELGLAAQPWKSWELLSEIGLARGDVLGADGARSEAVAWYRRYRWQGGLPDPATMQPFADVYRAVEVGAGRDLAARLEAASAAGSLPPSSLVCGRAFIAYARGDHAAVRAALDRLPARHTVEFELLLAGRWPDPAAAT